MFSIRGIVILFLLFDITFAFLKEGQKFPLSSESELDEDILRNYMDKGNVPFILGNASCQCGMPAPRTIVGGEDADTHQYPWVALLSQVESERLRTPYCGGALINNLYVLTASHCVDGMNSSKMEVVLREQNAPPRAARRRSQPSNPNKIPLGSIRVGVDRYIKHPHYSRLTLDNDIALLRLKIRVPMVDFPMSPICVPEETATFSQGVIATVAGYGETLREETGQMEGNLQMAAVRILSNELCNTPQFHKGKITPNMLCADGNGKGPCAGDTGGPLMIPESKYSSRHVLAGIASWSTTCNDPTRPAVYTRVSRYQSWIQSHTQDALWCGN